jgi:hypothetical protein
MIHNAVSLSHIQIWLDYSPSVLDPVQVDSRKTQGKKYTLWQESSVPNIFSGALLQIVGLVKNLRLWRGRSLVQRTLSVGGNKSATHTVSWLGILGTSLFLNLCASPNLFHLKHCESKSTFFYIAFLLRTRFDPSHHEL